MNQESGFTLVLALILLAVGALMTTPVMRLASTSIISRGIFGEAIKHDYAADAAVEYGLWRVMYEPGFIASLPPGEESDSFEVTINGVTASTTIVTQSSTGDLSGISMAGNHQILPEKTVFPTTATAGVPTTFTYTISMRRMEPDDLLFDPLDKVEDGLDIHFTYVPDSSKLDDVPFDDDDPMLNTPVKLTLVKRTFPDSDAQYDAMVDQASPDTNYGADETMDVQSLDGSRNRRSFVQFDLANIERVTSVTKAELELCADSPVAGSGRTYEIHRVTAPWNEATITWNTQPTVAGTATATSAPPDAGKCKKWNIESDLEAWLTGTPNYGWRITDSAEDSSTAKTTVFRSLENTAKPNNVPEMKRIETLPGYWNIEWDFDPNLDFPAYGDTRVLSFEASATLDDDTRYCNIAQVTPNNTNTNLSASVTVGTPPYPGCPGGDVIITKVADPAIILPGVPTVVTYTISITNNDVGDYGKFDLIEDYLPPYFSYVVGSASLPWPLQNSTDNPSYPYNICDFEPAVTSVADNRLKLKWHRGDSANGFEPGVDLCHDYPLPEGATYTLTFQAFADLTNSGSYYNELIVKIKDTDAYGGSRGIGGFQTHFSGPTAGTVVPDFDLEATTGLTTLRSNAVVTADGIEILSWHWKKRK